MQITKTDYLNFKFCRKDLWLKKNKPDEFPQEKLSEFQLGIVKEGQDVDAKSHNIFPGGIDVEGDQDVAIAETKYHMDTIDPTSKDQGEMVLFQAAIKNNPYYIRTDILKWNPKIKGWELYEVKATTNIKREKFNNHIYDLAFQYNVCKRDGLNIKKIGVIHLDKEYKKYGDINYNQLFKTEDVTEEVLKIADIVSEEMDLMIGYLNGPEEKQCQCRFRTRSEGNHCSTFSYSNPDIPKYAVHDVTRISGKKLSLLIDNEILAIDEIPDEFALSDNQVLQIQAAKQNKALIDIEEIDEFISNFQYPLYFLDYESYLPAIPRFNKYGPYQNIVFQYSLHILREKPPVDADLKWLDDNVEHTEFLATEAKDPSLDIVESLEKDIPTGDGTVIVWHKPFEMGRNRELGSLNPAKQKYMNHLNDRIVDLKEVFSKGMYVDPKFKGSASIKKVLPVISPDLSYDNLEINNGADANKMWGKMIKKDIDENEVNETQKNLLVYCKQDTWAMVRIWFYLKNLFN
jgi:hypothetical protein